MVEEQACYVEGHLLQKHLQGFLELLMGQSEEIRDQTRQKDQEVRSLAQDCYLEMHLSR